MKKGKAIGLLVVGSAITAAYLAWCSRPFFLRPKLEFDSRVTSEMQQFVVAWNDDMEFFEPEPFSWENFRRNLMKPNEVTIHPVSVTSTFTGNDVTATHSSRRASVMFRRDDYGWFTPIIRCANPPGYNTRSPTLGY